MTGLQKYFVKGKGSVAALLLKAAVLPGDRGSSALGIDTSFLLGRCQRSWWQGTHLDRSEESNWHMEAFISRSPGLALIWTIRDQKVISVLTLSSDIWMVVVDVSSSSENKFFLELQESSSWIPLRELDTSREQLILSKNRPDELPSGRAYVLFLPGREAWVYQAGLQHQIFIHLR